MIRSAFGSRLVSLLSIVSSFVVAACNAGGSDVPHDAQSSASDSMSAIAIKASDTTPGRVVNDSVARVEAAARAAAKALATTFPEIRYSLMPIATRGALDSLRKKFGKTDATHDAWRALTTMNRKEFGYIRVGDTIVVPDSVVPDLRAYSVFPQQYPGGASLPKLIMVSNAQQSYACYEYGQLVRFVAVNTGTESKATFPGRYALNWKERLRISSLNDNWKLPFTWNFHKYAGNAFHQFTMPGRPVSHSCVRQFMVDAEWLFDWGVGSKIDSNGDAIPFSGTPVVIIDMFDFNRKKGGPWLELASNRAGIVTLPPDPMAVEEALIPISQVPSTARGALPDRDRYKYAEDTLRARGVIRPEARLAASIDYNKRRDAKAKRNAPRRAARSKAPAAAPAAPAEAPPASSPSAPQ